MQKEDLPELIWVVPTFVCFLKFGCSGETSPKTEPVSGVVM